MKNAYRVEKTNTREWSLYKGRKFLRSFDSFKVAMATLAHVQHDDRKPAPAPRAVAATPHKFIVRVHLKDGRRKRVELRSTSMSEAAALFFPLTGLTLSDVQSATIMYNGSRKPRALTEVL